MFYSNLASTVDSDKSCCMPWQISKSAVSCLLRLTPWWWIISLVNTEIICLSCPSYRLYETVYECESDKRYGRSPLFGYNYSVLLAGDISVGDMVYTKWTEDEVFSVNWLLYRLWMTVSIYICVCVCKHHGRAKNVLILCMYENSSWMRF